MSVNSADSPAMIGDGYDEYRRYERYLALALGLGVVVAGSLLCPGPLWLGYAGLLLAIGGSFRRYHHAVHRYVGAPGPDTDRALQLWGTVAQACVWGAVPIVVALLMLQATS